jgi:hypothetical protein
MAAAWALPSQRRSNMLILGLPGLRCGDRHALCAAIYQSRRSRDRPVKFGSAPALRRPPGSPPAYRRGCR